MALPESVVEIVNAVRTGKCSTKEVVEAYIERIANHDDDLHAFISYDRDHALLRAPT